MLDLGGVKIDFINTDPPEAVQWPDGFRLLAIR